MIIDVESDGGNRFAGNKNKDLIYICVRLYYFCPYIDENCNISKPVFDASAFNFKKNVKSIGFGKKSMF